MLDNNKVMLVFGLSEEEKETLNYIVKHESLPGYKIIKTEMALMKVKDILNGLKFEIYGENLPEERVILLNNFTDVELHKAVTAIRSNFKVKPILAVITPTSIDWSFKDLLEHLIEEREWHRANNKRGM